MSARISIGNPYFTGLALAEPEGAAVVTPAWRTTGRLWWKKHEPGFAVQLVVRHWQHCGAYVDSYNVWRCKGFFLSSAKAAAFRREVASYPVPIRSLTEGQGRP